MLQYLGNLTVNNHEKLSYRGKPRDVFAHFAMVWQI